MTGNKNENVASTLEVVAYLDILLAIRIVTMPVIVFIVYIVYYSAVVCSM